MSKNNFEHIVNRSLALREKYHELEVKYHGSAWTVEEDALAYLTDAGLIGRAITSEQKRWPKTGSKEELEHKLGENIWWLIVLAYRSGIDINLAVDKFLDKTEKAI